MKCSAYCSQISPRVLVMGGSRRTRTATQAVRLRFAVLRVVTALNDRRNVIVYLPQRGTPLGTNCSCALQRIADVAAGKGTAHAHNPVIRCGLAHGRSLHRKFVWRPKALFW